MYVGLHEPGWLYVRARNPSPRGLATLNPQSTCHRPRPGPKLACGFRAVSPRATEPRARGKTRGRKRKKCRWAKKTHLYLYICTWSKKRLFFALFACENPTRYNTSNQPESTMIYLLRITSYYLFFKVSELLACVCCACRSLSYPVRWHDIVCLEGEN